jgi:hypothetical protein
MKPTDFKPGQEVFYFKPTGRAKHTKYSATVVKINEKSVWISVPEFIKLVRTPAENLQLK